jgi:hypothetical protein
LSVRLRDKRFTRRWQKVNPNIRLTYTKHWSTTLWHHNIYYLILHTMSILQLV